MAELQGDNITNSAGTGAPKFPFGVVTPANMRAPEGGGTVVLSSADNTSQVFDLTANEIVKLPSTGVAAGEVFYLENINPSSTLTPLTLTVQAADASIIDHIDKGHIYLMALSANPGTASAWRILDLYSFFVFETTLTFNNGGSPGPLRSFLVSRHDREVTMTVGTTAMTGTAGTGSTTLQADAALPAYYQAAFAGPAMLVAVQDGAAQLAQVANPGLFRIETGTIALFRDPALSTTWPNGALVAGMSNYAADAYTISYNLG
jgi:hypothetical protein